MPPRNFEIRDETIYEDRKQKKAIQDRLSPSGYLNRDNLNSKTQRMGCASLASSHSVAKIQQKLQHLKSRSGVSNLQLIVT